MTELDWPVSEMVMRGMVFRLCVDIVGLAGGITRSIVHEGKHGSAHGRPIPRAQDLSAIKTCQSSR